MAKDKKTLPSLTTRQKITALAFLIVLVVLGWQLVSFFQPESHSDQIIMPLPKGAPPIVVNQSNPVQTSSPPVLPVKPAPTPPPRPPVLSATEIAQQKAEQEAKNRYIAAINELQMLRISRDIEETNQAIATAKLATITAQQKMGALTTPVIEAPPTNQSAEPASLFHESNYKVISVSQLRHKWHAVISYGNNLYEVSVGDILPFDGSRVVSINKTGVTLLLNNQAIKKLSLVPII